MAIYGFSIFLGIFPIGCFVVIAITLFTFKKYRSDYRTFYDAAFCASMASHMVFYYMALNYPESIDSPNSNKRNFFACVLIVMINMLFMTMCFGWMTAGAFWQLALLKVSLTPENPPDEAEDEERGVRFADSPTEPHRVRVLRGLNNNIMAVVFGVGICLPIIYIILDILLNKTYLIDTGNRCWLGSSLMFVCMMLPCILCMSTSLGFLAWTVWKIDIKQFFTRYPDDPRIRNLQIRTVLVLCLGLWWLIEIPVLGNAKLSTVLIQHLKGVLYIPLSILSFYIFVIRTPDVIETWDENFPLGVRAKVYVKSIWKYDIKRPTQRKILRYKSKRSQSQKLSSKCSSPGHSRGECVERLESTKDFTMELPVIPQQQPDNEINTTLNEYQPGSSQNEYNNQDTVYVENVYADQTIEPPNVYMNRSSDSDTPVADNQPNVIRTQPESLLQSVSVPPSLIQPFGSRPEIHPQQLYDRDSPLYAETEDSSEHRDQKI